MFGITRIPRRGLWRVLGLVLLVLLARAGVADARTAPVDLCRELARAVEQVEGIPPGLVQAVALAESGRWSERLGRTYAWPWTVTSGRESYYLPTKAAALAKLRELRAEGRTNIDVGCMQVNLHHHGDAFASFEDALDPASNVTYGAEFLKRLREETRSWARATAHYHSRHPKRGEAYRSKVFRIWEGMGGEFARERATVRFADGGTVLRGGERSAEAPAATRPLLELSHRSTPLLVLRGE